MGGAAYSIWWDGIGGQWIVNDQIPGTTGSNYWFLSDASPSGDYTAFGLWTGSPHVGLIV